MKLAAFLIGMALGALLPVPKSGDVELHETFYFSRECPSSSWVEIEHTRDHVTFECDYDDEVK